MTRTEGRPRRPRWSFGPRPQDDFASRISSTCLDPPLGRVFAAPVESAGCTSARPDERGVKAGDWRGCQAFSVSGVTSPPSARPTLFRVACLVLLSAAARGVLLLSHGCRQPRLRANSAARRDREARRSEGRGRYGSTLRLPVTRKNESLGTPQVVYQHGLRQHLNHALRTHQSEETQGDSRGGRGAEPGADVRPLIEYSVSVYTYVEQSLCTQSDCARSNEMSPSVYTSRLRRGEEARASLGHLRGVHTQFDVLYLRGMNCISGISTTC